ncbi:MAG: hypothetical protein KDI82_09365 [Gammaproteobacteria bacterium]|nr:hypothetical protein [Gammaproteobacteria bacterium]
MMGPEVIALFALFIVSSIYSYRFVADEKQKRSERYLKAVQGFDGMWPESGMIFSPGSGVVVTRVAWFVAVSPRKTVRDIAFLVFHSLSYVALVAIIVRVFL